MAGGQKYQHRRRILYALLFDSGRAYIGQTIEPRRREKEHRRAWQEPFRFMRLGQMDGTESQAVEHEYAWRWLAHRAGYAVLAKSRGGAPFIVRNPRARMNDERFRIASGHRWPRAWRRRSPLAWLWQWLAWQSGALAGCWLLLQVQVPAGW